ncbi:MAG: hypothetical protein LBG65_03120 [Puniceicoccales bacterium]|nr:hypothetical protein [Puniceicoccales bacterium]
MSGFQSGKNNNASSRQGDGSRPEKHWRPLASLPGKLNLGWLLPLSMAVGGALSVRCGIDANYDLKKYHLHNGWALLNGRLGVDLFPAGLQTYYPPLLDVPYYLLAVEWFPDSPRIVTFLMGIPTGILIFLTFLCIHQVLRALPGFSEIERRFFAGLLAFFGLGGTSLVIQIGSTTNEVQTACLVLGALAAFLSLRERHPIAAATAAGALLGAGTGFKLTAAPYTVAFAAGLLAQSGGSIPSLPRFLKKTRAAKPANPPCPARGVPAKKPLSHKFLPAFVSFSGAWWVAFLAVYGWWGCTLYKLTGNPVFPMYNNIFKSDWIPEKALPGSWFVPQSLQEALFFPFTWVNSRAISASAGTDLRFAFAYVTAAVWVVFLCLQWGRRLLPANTNQDTRTSLQGDDRENPGDGCRLLPKAAKFIIVFLLFGFVIWEALFSVLRYAIPMEVLLGLVPFIATWHLLDSLGVRQGDKKRNLALAAILITLTVLATATTKFPFWGRVRDDAKNPQKRVFDVSIPKLPDNSLVVLYTPETQFLAPFIAKENPTATFVSPGDEPLFLLRAMKDGSLRKRVLDRIREHPGPVLVLLHHGYTGFSKHLADFGLSISSNLYQRIPTSYEAFNTGDFQLHLAEKTNASNAANNPHKEAFAKGIPLPDPHPFHFSANDMGMDLHKRLHFVSGWKPAGGNGFWKSTKRASRINFYLSREEIGKLESPLLELSGEWIHPQTLIVSLNGTPLPPRQQQAGASSLLHIPKGLLRDVTQGANTLTFEWPGARAADDLPWPLVRRPRSGTLPLEAFVLHKLRLLPRPASTDAR